MNVVTTALNDRPVKKRGVGVLACRLPHRPGACLFSPRAQLVAPKPPSDGGSPEAKACQFARRALFLCASVVKIREFHFAPLRLCVESGQPFLPRASGLSPHSRFIRALRAIRGQPESFPRGAGVLACRLPHRPGASSAFPRPQIPDARPQTRKFIRVHPTKSDHRNYE